MMVTLKFFVGSCSCNEDDGRGGRGGGGGEDSDARFAIERGAVFKARFGRMFSTLLLSHPSPEENSNVGL
jgi:hypothetical protein